jgi:hypothetical protein
MVQSGKAKVFFIIKPQSVRAEEGWEARQSMHRPKNLCQGFETAQKDAQPLPERIGGNDKKNLSLKAMAQSRKAKVFFIIKPRSVRAEEGWEARLEAYTSPKISAKASRQRKKTRFLSPNGLGVTIRKT